MTQITASVFTSFDSPWLPKGSDFDQEKHGSEKRVKHFLPKDSSSEKTSCSLFVVFCFYFFLFVIFNGNDPVIDFLSHLGFRVPSSVCYLCAN